MSKGVAVPWQLVQCFADVDAPTHAERTNNTPLAEVRSPRLVPYVLRLIRGCRQELECKCMRSYIRVNRTGDQEPQRGCTRVLACLRGESILAGGQPERDDQQGEADAVSAGERDRVYHPF